MAELARYQTIKTELDTDPLTRGYAGMTDQEVTDDLNTVYRTQIKPLLTGIEVRSAFDETEFGALTESKQQMALSWGSGSEFDSTTDGADDLILKFLFGAGSTTRTNLGTVRSQNVSRATELGLGGVVIGDVENARALV